MVEGSIPSLAGANSNGETLERTFVKHSKKNRSSDLVGIDRCNTSPAQSGAAGESAAAGGPKCKKPRVKLRIVAVGANCEGLHSSKS